MPDLIRTVRLVREAVRSSDLDISMNNPLVVKVFEAVQDLKDVESDEGFREATKLLHDGVQRAVLAVSVANANK